MWSCIHFEGKILTIETVCLKLPKRQWHGPDIKPDETSSADEYLRHVLYITRIYFCYGPQEDELIGMNDITSSSSSSLVVVVILIESVIVLIIIIRAVISLIVVENIYFNNKLETQIP